MLWCFGCSGCARQLFGHHPANGIERIRIHVFADIHHSIPHDTAIRYDDDQCGGGADRHQLQIAYPKRPLRFGAMVTSAV